MERYIPRPRELALERLKAYILEHHLQPGDCLPPERELCRSWGVNRTTLRSAIARLEASGLLYAVQGSGTRIRHRFRISLDHLSSFSEAAVACGFQAPGLTEDDLVNGSLFQTLEQSCRVKLKYGAAKISLKHVTTEEAGILNLAPGASAFQIITEINTDDSAPMGYVHSVGRADKIEMVSSMRWEREKENMP